MSQKTLYQGGHGGTRGISIKIRCQERDENDWSSKLHLHHTPEWRAMSLEQDEREIHALFEAGDRALMENDVQTLSRVFAHEYVQYNDSSQPVTREAVFNDLRSGKVRYPSIGSTKVHEGMLL